MSNNYPNPSKSSGRVIDILDFLDSVKNDKALSNGGNLDIVDIVKTFYGLNHTNHQAISSTMSKSVKDEEYNKAPNSLTLSRKSTMSKDLEVEIDKYQYLFDERAGIYQFDAGLSKENAEKKALEGIKLDYAKELGLKDSHPQIETFINSIKVTL